LFGGRPIWPALPAPDIIGSIGGVLTPARSMQLPVRCPIVAERK